jgi:hypothetical protein
VITVCTRTRARARKECLGNWSGTYYILLLPAQKRYPVFRNKVAPIKWWEAETDTRPTGNSLTHVLECFPHHYVLTTNIFTSSRQLPGLATLGTEFQGLDPLTKYLTRNQGQTLTQCPPMAAHLPYCAREWPCCYQTISREKAGLQRTKELPDVK